MDLRGVVCIVSGCVMARYSAIGCRCQLLDAVGAHRFVGSLFGCEGIALGWQRYGELGALALLRCHLDSAMVHVDNTLCEVESDAGAYIGYSFDVASLIESAEQMRQILLGNARARVAHCYNGMSVVGMGSNGHHSALRCVLDGVRHEIAHHLLHLFRVEPHKHLVGHFNLQRDVLAQCILGVECGSVAQQSRHVGVACVYVGVTLLLLTEVEQFGDEAAQLVAVTVDARQLVACVARALHFLYQRVSQADYHRERSAYLVRHVKEEAQFRLVLLLNVSYALFLKFERFGEAYAVAVFEREPPNGSTDTHYIYNIRPP